MKTTTLYGPSLPEYNAKVFPYPRVRSIVDAADLSIALTTVDPIL